MLNQPVLFLDEIDLADTPSVGPKAATLGLLRQSGLPVPNGFVIPATALQRFVVESELAGAVAELEALARQMPELVASSPLLEQVSQAFLHGQKFTRGSVELERAFDALVAETGAVAVRSSAIAEDRAEASFAGQQLSVLNVRAFPDLIRAVWRTWASLFSPAAVRYRARFAPADALPAMAVLVQAQISCDAAGTMFTVDPLTGRPRVVIEATWGLGEAIAQGEVDSDRYLVDPRTLADAAPAQIGNKRCQRVLSEREGTRLTSVPEWRRQDLVLTTSQRSALALLGLQAEQILTGPQDLEWGLAGGRWWIFQSRPITTRVAADEPEAESLEHFDWTSGFLDERLVEPVSPLGWSVLRAGLEELAFRSPLRMLGVNLDKLGPLTRLWNGHPYTNVAVFESLYKLFPDWLLPEDARRFFPEGDATRRKRARQPASLRSPRVWLSLARGLISDLPAASPIQNPVTWVRFERAYREGLADLDRRIADLELAAEKGEGIDLKRVLGLVDEVDE
ncbi:MAG TPA: PEP/pyruvate-binding domain-containing protein, partial [Chloroflexota bacterium]|nr:PEP/pyruvate-binding domain-containing protein [Chloroflexota bacterium]